MTRGLEIVRILIVDRHRSNTSAPTYHTIADVMDLDNENIQAYSASHCESYDMVAKSPFELYTNDAISRRDKHSPFPLHTIIFSVIIYKVTVLARKPAR